MDKRFKVTAIAQTPYPQRVIYAAMHQDYSSEPISELPNMTEQKAGETVIKRLLDNNRGHYGCLEHPAITLNCANFPHSVMQQARTHRVGITFDCQSFRYTGSHICKVANGEIDIEDVFYFRPAGEYRNRAGKRFTYTDAHRNSDIIDANQACAKYRDRFTLEGFAEEHLRSEIKFDYRQHFTVSYNMRSLMHFLDLRSKKDAQLEIQHLCQLMMDRFEDWSPDLATWYKETREGKGLLAP